MKRHLSLVALALLAAVALSDSYVLQNVRIVTPGMPVVERGMIIVSGDKIVHVGAPTAYESGYAVLDCTGLTAYPGFIDSYTQSHLSLPPAPGNAEARSAVDGPLASMWHENRKAVYADLDVSAHVDAKSLNARHKQGVTVAMLASGRGAFGGQTAIAAMLDGEKATLVASRTFQEMSFNTSGAGYPSSAMARIAFMRQLLFDGEHYVANPPQNGVPDATVSAIGDVATGLQRALFAADSEREIQRALDLADEFGIKMTLFGKTAVADHAAELNRRGIAAIMEAGLPREPRKELSEDPDRRLNDPPLAYLLEQHRKWEEECLATVRAHKAGVRFAFSSEGGADTFLQDVRRHVELGLPKDAALAALTKDAAEILGIADRAGTIEVGKLANLVLMSGDWELAESKVKHVFVNGTKFDIAEGN
jgi:imidazolonepropionase-like amidohydrolase